MERFFQHVSEHPGIAYVVIQHLSPDYRSMMNELLGRKSDLRIVHIDDGTRIEPNTVYLNRAETFAELDGDVFRTEPYQDGDGLPHLPIDRFFASLTSRDPAETIAVVLSGSGSDGAAGTQILHELGAAVLAQTPHEAAFASMPRAVLLSGFVDSVLSVAEMPALIEDIFRDGKASAVPDTSDANNVMVRILKRLEGRHKVDFTAYKLSSVHRRVMRRLHLRGLPSLETYDTLLGENFQVLDELFEDMLIGVTEFYRDPHAIEQLRRTILDPLAKEGDSDAPPLKIWVPACASGEEVYTIAIELSEALRAAGNQRGFRVIGTDVHAGSIDRASRGVYAADKLAAMPDAIRERYFQPVAQGYMVDPVLRQKIIFSHHNLISDPPFMNLDLISCRNLLIYLQEEAQASVMSMFLFGLKDGGGLFLGASESVGKFSAAFDVVDARWRLFRKLDRHSGSVSAMLPRREAGAFFPVVEPSVPHAERPKRRAFQSEVQDIRSREGIIRAYDALLKRYAPTSILISGDGKVLTWFGAAGQLIDTMSNLAEWTVQDIVHPDLHFVISVGAEKLRQGHSVRHERIVSLALADGVEKDVRVEVETLIDSTVGKVLLVKIDMQDPAPVEDVLSDTPPHAADGEDIEVLSHRIRALERDLRLTEETLQHATERLEASGEELQASNEELQASNEELQASNEELQSSNEELHAVNEELVSLSAEHERKIELLQELGVNTEIVLRMLGTGILVLDAERKIRRFSQLIERDFFLHEHDLGRSIAIVGPRLEFADLNEMANVLGAEPGPLKRTGVHDGRDLQIEARSVPVGAGGQEGGVVFLFRWL